jgi:hypothetical protein
VVLAVCVERTDVRKQMCADVCARLLQRATVPAPTCVHSFLPDRRAHVLCRLLCLAGADDGTRHGRAVATLPHFTCDV